MARLSLSEVSWGWLTMTLKLIQEAQKEVTADKAGPQGSSWSGGKQRGVSWLMEMLRYPVPPLYSYDMQEPLPPYTEPWPGLA